MILRFETPQRLNFDPIRKSESGHHKGHNYEFGKDREREILTLTMPAEKDRSLRLSLGGEAPGPSTSSKTLTGTRSGSDAGLRLLTRLPRVVGVILHLYLELKDRLRVVKAAKSLAAFFAHVQVRS
jgi:hypothetical protein